MTENVPLGRVPRRARRTINDLLSSRAITPEGLAWLIAATDPFHDEPINVDGFPDVTTSRCITQCLTYTTNVTTPTPGTDALWDAHVFLNPNSPPISANGSNHDFSFRRALVDADGRYQQTQPGTGAVLYSGINAVTLPTGQDWQSSAATVSTNSLAIPFTFASGYYRVIACGFEVVNTTAELYKGGTLTAYRSPAYCQPGLLTYDKSADTGTPVIDLPCLYQFANLPPSTQAQATLYPNSRTWGASEGCYVTQCVNVQDMPFIAPMPAAGAGLILGLPNETLLNDSTRTCWVPHMQNEFVGSPYYNRPMNSPLPFDISGAVIAGLNSNSTLQVTARYYIERLPAISDPNILVLAKNPAPYDPLVLEIYCRAMMHLPVGVKVSENPLGEWFYDVVQSIASFAPMLGAALAPIAGPLAPMIGTAVGAAGNSFASNRPKPQQQQNQTTTTTTVTRRPAKPLPPIPQKKKAPQPPPKPRRR